MKGQRSRIALSKCWFVYKTVTMITNQEHLADKTKSFFCLWFPEEEKFVDVFNYLLKCSKMCSQVLQFRVLKLCKCLKE